MAMMYSDTSVNEMHHCAHLFQTSHDSNFDIFSEFTYDEYTEMRKTILRLILATDMSKV
jgi:hypothetical protein